MNRRALEGSEKALRKEHPDTVTSVNNLAIVLQDQGKYEKAETMNRRVLKGNEKALGKEHSNTLTSIDNLAGVL
jgi:Tetratricopeptide repeat